MELNTLIAPCDELLPMFVDGSEHCQTCIKKATDRMLLVEPVTMKAQVRQNIISLLRWVNCHQGGLAR